MNTMKILLSLFLIIFLTTGKNLNAQQQFLIANSAFSNGSAYTTNSSFQLGATFGQTFIGQMSNSNYMTGIGFWYSVSEKLTDVDEELEKIPQEYRLDQNYPNPFSTRGGSAFGGNPITTISFALPKPSEVKLIVFDILGREIDMLVDQKMESGYHTVIFDAGNLPSGIYIYKLKAENFIDINP